MGVTSVAASGRRERGARAYGRSRCRATTPRWTSSGPSARRRLRAPAYAAASGKSSLMPPPPCSWMARSMTSHAICGTAALISETSERAPSDADGVELPGGVEDEQTSRVDVDAGAGEAFAVAPEGGEGLAERDPLGGAPAGELEGLLRETDEPHAVVHPPRPEAALGDLERPARSGEDAARRQADVGQRHLTVAERLVVVTEGRKHPLHPDPGRAPWGRRPSSAGGGGAPWGRSAP